MSFQADTLQREKFTLLKKARKQHLPHRHNKHIVFIKLMFTGLLRVLYADTISMWFTIMFRADSKFEFPKIKKNLNKAC